MNERRPGSLAQAVAITLIILAVFELLSHLRLPTLSPNVYEALGAAGQDRVRALTVGGFGTNPLVEGFVLVEIAALIVPRWNRLRWGGPELRSRLDRAAVVVAVVLSAFQGFGVAVMAEGLTTQMVSTRAIQQGASAAPATSQSMPVIAATVALFCLVTYGLWRLSRVIDRHGFGHGLSLLVAWQTLRALTEPIRDVHLVSSGENYFKTHDPLLTLFCMLGAGITMLALLKAQWRFHPYSPGDSIDSSAQVELPIPLLVCGLIPWSWSQSVPQLPTAIGSLVNANTSDWNEAISSQSWVRPVLAFAFAIMFARAFYDSRRVATALRLDSEASSLATIAALRRQLASAGVLAALALTVLVLLIDWLGQHHVTVDWVSVAIVVAVALDCIAEWRNRRRGEALVWVHSAHRVYEADAVLAVLTGSGIAALAQGRTHRLLLHFFGPYIPIRILVARPDEQRARELISGDRTTSSGTHTPHV